MFSLKNHPFAVETFFESSLVLTYAVPKTELAARIPECLQLDTWNDEWAFIAVALVKSENLRPRGFPVWMGQDFVLTGFRIFVRYTDNRGRRLRGLYILKSETNKSSMSFFGNIFTHYRYQTTDIQFNSLPGNLTVRSKRSDLDIVIEKTVLPPELPAGSPFRDWKEARRFAGPLPFTFSYSPGAKEVLIVEGVREHWDPWPVKVTRAKIGFVDNLGLKAAVLASSFLVEQIPYYWKKGKLETWKP